MHQEYISVTCAQVREKLLGFLYKVETSADPWQFTRNTDNALLGADRPLYLGSIAVKTHHITFKAKYRVTRSTPKASASQSMKSPFVAPRLWQPPDKQCSEVPSLGMMPLELRIRGCETLTLRAFSLRVRANSTVARAEWSLYTNVHKFKFVSLN